MLVIEPFSENDIVPFISTRHAIGKKAKISLEEFFRTPLVIRGGEGREDELGRLGQRISKTTLVPNIVLRCDSSLAVKSAVEGNVGIGLLSRHHVASGVNEGRLRILKIPAFAMKIRRFIIHGKVKPLSDTAQGFLDLLHANKTMWGVAADGGSRCDGQTGWSRGPREIL